MSSEVTHYLGQRLSFIFNLCTVRYVGPVTGTKGTWLGVEWDDPHAGKHAGTHQGREYFKCRSAWPRAASFIRPTRPADTPLSFLEALREKYASDYPLNIGDRAIEISGKIVEEVGFEKIRRLQAVLQDLKVVLLDGQCLAGLGSTPCNDEPSDWTAKIKELKETCPRVTELNMSRSLLESFKDIVGVCRALPTLKLLTINGNRLRDLSVTDIDSTVVNDAFAGIAELNIDENLLTWDEAVHIASFFPSLQKFSLAANHLSSTTIPFSAATIRTLNLAHNNITSLSALSTLARLPNLTTLSLHDNAIQTLTPSPTFAHLQSLDISSNDLPDLSSLNPLHISFPSLTSLRLSNNPFFAALPIDDAHILSLSRVPSITTLNFSPISDKERQNAELYYLSRIAAELGTVSPDEEARILENHPLWGALSEKYGQPVVKRPAKGEAGQGTLGARLLALRVRLGAKKGCGGGGEEEKTITVPKSINVYMLKSVLGNRFGILPVTFRVIWETGEWDPVGTAVGRGKGEEISDARWDVDDVIEEVMEGNISAEEGPESARKGRFVRREVEVVEGTSSVGFWIGGNEANLRLEMVRRY